MKIFLLGLPGSGKTTLGKALASALGVTFIDLDLEIENQAGKKITELFKERGENYFRELESVELKKWCDSAADFVMATGGGTPCFFDNMTRINKSGKSIFLDVPAREIVRRINNSDVSVRPLLAVRADELKDHIEWMRSHRIRFYNQASFILPGEAITVDEIMNKIND